MKLILSALVISLVAVTARAQDVIMKADQTEISAKVIEITENEVKYKPFTRQDGPIYSLKKSDIFVIIYKDGTREKFGTTAAPVYGQTPILPPETPATTPPVAAYSSSVSSSTTPSGKRQGWSGNLGYTTAMQNIGGASGITYGLGYYFLGKGRQGGVVFDLDVMNFFGEGTPNYGLASANGVLRFSETSKFYLGGGVGYSTVSVEVSTIDRYGVKKTTKFSEGYFGGKAFMGYGLLRLGLVWPSFQAIDGGLITVGLSVNPFH
ncbi:hypothetical protein [uncultured Spirosoma sp.]|uniref:hypothetical protein n=1 Tax=uncultured Spirosoma sp. TaxID=278208 RepID=UPI00258BB2EB|nr:hypothetical protein [uncultured Spirosoma sp.]